MIWRLWFRLRYHLSCAAALNRRVGVEQFLLDAANGKRPPPTPEECRQLAFRLAGVGVNPAKGKP